MLSPPPSIYVIVLLALIATQLTPYLIDRRRGRLCFLAMVLIGQFLYCSCDEICSLVAHDFSFLQSAYAGMALPVLLGATLCTAAAYLIVHRLTGPPPPLSSFEPLALKPRQVALIGTLAMLGPWVAPYAGRFSVPLLHWQFVAVAALYCTSCQKSVQILRLFQALLPVSIGLFFLRQGALFPALGLISVWLTLLAWRPSARRFALFTLMAFTLAMAQLVKGEFRQLQTLNPGLFTRVRLLAFLTAEQFSRWERSDLSFDELKDCRLQNDPRLAENFEAQLNFAREITPRRSLPLRLLRALNRLGDDSLKQVLIFTPREVPFWGGKTYSGLHLLLAPKLLWPHKPSWEIWHEFGVRYHYLRPDDKTTSVAFNYLAEGYMSFGAAGLVLAALLFGALIAIVERIAFAAPRGLRVLALLCLIRPLLFPCDAFTVLSQVIASTLCVILLSLLVTRRQTFSWSLARPLISG